MTRVLVQATVHLPGLPAGRQVAADPDVEYVAMCISRGYVIVLGPIEDSEPATEGDE